MIFRSPEQVVMNRLFTYPLVAYWCSLRIYPQIAPASASFPFAVYRRTGADRQGTFTGVVGTPLVTLSLDMYALTYESCRGFADSVRQALDGWNGTSYGVDIRRISLLSESDELVTLDGGELPQAYQVTQDYQILWQEI